MIVNVRDFGAVGDGATKDTNSIQAAVDYCAEQGGGTVLVPRGHYLSGTIVLKSYINFHLQGAARIISSMEEHDFSLPPSALEEEPEKGRGALICARQVQGVSLTGLGTIDGRGEQFLEPEEDDNDYVLLPITDFRPKLIDLEGCSNVLIQDVTLYRASSWGLHLTGCNQVNITGIKILGQHRGPNNDGIDPDCCKDVHISNCHIETGDDCIVIKSTKYAAERYGPCENITVTNCTLMSHDSGIKIGTETHADIRNVVVQNCVIRNSNRGIGIWVRDGATVENMLFSNIIIETRLFSDATDIMRPLRWWGKGEPIFITAESRSGQQHPGHIRNIGFDHIYAEAEGCVYMEGCEASIIENITVRALKQTMRVKSGYAGGLFDTQPSMRGVFAHHIPAIFCRYAKHITFNDVEVRWGGSPNVNWTNALYGEHIENLCLKHFIGGSAKQTCSAIELKHTSGVSVEASKAAPGTGVFLSLTDVDPAQIFLAGNDFSKAADPVRFADNTAAGLFMASNRLSKELDT